MNVLKYGIKFHRVNEILCLPENFDFKYGHWNSLSWICARWFINAKTLNDVPKWYVEILSIINKNNPGRQCFKVVEQLLDILDKYKYK